MRHRTLITFIFVLTMSFLATAYHEERSSLDLYTPFLRRFKTVVFNRVRDMHETRQNRLILELNGKLQKKIPDDSLFPCNLNITLRSKDIPNSVHRLRPGDIDVVGALGDSLTAGVGSLAPKVIDVYFHEARGTVFSIGGQETWKTFLTLPNILKIFNPNVYGYSLNSISIDRKSKFNVAEEGAISENMPYMAKILMITIFIGHNDFCSTDCYNNNYRDALSRHKRDIIEVLEILKKDLPRTIVNLVPPIHLSVLSSLRDTPDICKLTHAVSCPCLMGMKFARLRNQIMDLMEKWQKLDLEISNYPQFDTDDFTVIKHVFTINYTLPKLKEDKNDYGLLAPDCFHASQRGHAKLASDLWNSLLEPYDMKTTNPPEFKNFLCPSEENPYISTRRNFKKKP